MTKTIETINYDALSIWEKLANPPQYKRANQVMSLVIDKMNNQNFQTFYYANYLYEVYFNSYSKSGCKRDSGYSSATCSTVSDTGPLYAIDNTPTGGEVDPNDPTKMVNQNSARTNIWNNKQYGMRSQNMLTFWVDATLEYMKAEVAGTSPHGSKAYETLIKNFGGISGTWDYCS